MSIVDVMLRSMWYEHANPEKQRAFQQKELHKLVSYVRANSPKLGEMYKDIGDDFDLTDLPVTNKQMIMENFDSWVTDSRIRKSELKTFLSNPANIGKPYLKDYLVVTTSGSSGHPLYFLLNKKTVNVSTCSALLSKALNNRPVALMYPMKQFLIPTSSIMQNMRRFPRIMKKNYILIDAMMPMDRVVKKLNRMQPKALYSYPSMMELLADEAVKGNLKIHVEEVVCASEKLTEKARAYIEEVFHCKAKSIYGCTEGGNLGCDCNCHHLHLNNPYAILEPVDENNNPVPIGQKAHKILLTNLANDVVPIIRYEVMDNVIIHQDPCPCGNPAPWMEIEGRSTSSLLHFSNGAQIVPVVLYFLIETMDSLRRFQIVLHEDDRLEFRAVFMPGVDRREVFHQVEDKILGYLRENGVEHASMYLSDQAPCVDPVTSKFKSVYQA